MFIIAGNQSNDTNIRTEEHTRQCLNCGNYGYHRISERDNKLTLFFIPLITWSKQYFRTCPNCGIKIEINRNEVY